MFKNAKIIYQCETREEAAAKMREINKFYYNPNAEYIHYKEAGKIFHFVVIRK